MPSRSSGLARWVLFAALALALSGCATLSGSLPEPASPAESLAEAPPPETVQGPGPDPVGTAQAQAAESPAQAGLAALAHAPAGGDGNETLFAAAVDSSAEDADDLLALVESPGIAQRAREPADIEIEEYDPWEPFNEKMFEFNRWLDRWLLKPVAKAYNRAVPPEMQQAIDNAFSNLRFLPRFVNSLLQGKFDAAGRELARFLINSTVGHAGLFDIARAELNFQKSNEDFGQTLGVWGIGPGPYLMLPFLPPLTVRDGIGRAVDGAMDPLSYVLPFIWDRFGMKVGDTINDRALNLDLYQGFEETTVEFYSALRNAYLQRRQKLITE